MNKKTKIILVIILVIFLGFTIFLFSRTGIAQASKIDERDLKYWNYTSEKIIQNSEEFEINGTNETCWLLIHSYTSTPNEMRALANKINSEFGDYVYVPLLEGHGQVPNKILNKSLDNWYSQILEDYKLSKKNCEKINVIGSSIGGGIALKLAEEEDLNNLYLVNPYLFPPYHFYYIFNLNTYLKYTSPILHYSKKTRLAQINDDDGMKNHIAYWNMPFDPMKNSFKFFEEVKLNLDKITEPTLTQQSINDKASSIESSRIIDKKISSEIKNIITFEKSNHVLLMDYDREEVIANIINFEKQNR